MPRGKYVNHKGRSRHFTSPEELQQEKDEDTSEEEGSTEGEDDGKAGAAGASSSKVRSKPKVRAKNQLASSTDSESDEEESSEDDRDARKGVASLIEIENPNRVVKKAAQKIQNLAIDGEEGAASQSKSKPELTRREREQIEKQKARQRYEKLHAAGKTSEAKADLARLALIRQQRADAAAKREAEKKALEEKKTTSKA